MRNAILAVALAGLAGAGGPARAAADPAKAAFQAGVCSVLAMPARWEATTDEASQKRAEALSMAYERGWTPVRLGWRAGRSTCRKPREIDFLQVTSDRSAAMFSHRTGTGSIDCYYERSDGRWRPVACVENLIVVN
jgi:hypothetical protein